jgi:hypothetical protein
MSRAQRGGGGGGKMVEWGGGTMGAGGLTYLLCGEGKKSRVKCRLVNAE